MSLSANSKWTGTLIQLCTFIAIVFGGGWWAKTISSKLDQIHEAQANFVTQTQAERYVAEIRWRNAGKELYIPDPRDFKDKP